MPTGFEFDVFLSHSAKDKEVVRDIAQRLRKDGLRVWFDATEIKSGGSVAEKIERGLENSRVLVLCMSANAFRSDWATQEAATFRFSDPLNKERRLIPLRLDEAPITVSIAQVFYINWSREKREEAYAKLLESCRPASKHMHAGSDQFAENAIQLDYNDMRVHAYAFSPDRRSALSGAPDKTVRFWDLETGRCLRVLRGHTGKVRCVAWSGARGQVASGAEDNTVRVWNAETGRCLRVLRGHTSFVLSIAWSADGRRILSGGSDDTLRLWDAQSGRALRALKDKKFLGVWCVAMSADGRIAFCGTGSGQLCFWNLDNGHIIYKLPGFATVQGVSLSGNRLHAFSGSADNTLKLWDIHAGECLRVFEGHTNSVTCVASSADGRNVLSGSSDHTVRLWNVETGRCQAVLVGHSDGIETVAWSADQRHAVSGAYDGGIRLWDLSEFVTDGRVQDTLASTPPSAPDQVQYTNAKVLLVGDTSAGKTGLAHRLATGHWKPSDGSTVGAWSTQWKLRDSDATLGVEREIWLWDFGGQADQRLVHQLYMDRSALILLLFNADQEDVLPGLRDWLTALRRCVPTETPQFLIAGRIDAGFKAGRSKLQAFAKEHALAYYETSALDGTGCKGVHAAILSTIPWAKIPVTTTEQLFKRIKDEILKLRDEGQVLHTFKELRDLLWHRLPNEAQFTDDTLRTVIGHLDAPGAVKELDYGSYILLAPEWINAYAQAVIRTLRSDLTELGRLPLRSITEGNLAYQSVERDGNVVEMKRLPPQGERVVLAEMERQLLERGLCLRQGDKLVFPSHCGRDRPAVVEHPSIFVSYAVKGYLDDIYATLAVKLADSESFVLKELWRDAADFDTLEGGHRMGIKLTRESASSGEISVYFGPGVTQEEQVIFANYIHAHLVGGSEQVQRLRYYVCPRCHTPKGNPQVLMEKLLAKKQKADTECDKCGNRFPLWDALEKKFASEAVRAQVQGLQVQDDIRLDARRKGKLLALEVAARITSADQKCFEIPGTEDEGLDMEVEFTDSDGKGTGERIYLQLKAGNSYLRRKRDGTEIFTIKKQRWVEYWLKQDRPVLLVIGTFPDGVEGLRGEGKERFADIRWMEIGELLKRDSDNGKKPVKRIVFKGQRLDALSVRRWRDRALPLN